MADKINSKKQEPKHFLEASADANISFASETLNELVVAPASLQGVMSGYFSNEARHMKNFARIRDGNNFYHESVQFTIGKKKGRTDFVKLFDLKAERCGPRDDADVERGRKVSILVEDILKEGKKLEKGTRVFDLVLLVPKKPPRATELEELATLERLPVVQDTTLQPTEEDLARELGINGKAVEFTLPRFPTPAPSARPSTESLSHVVEEDGDVFKDSEEGEAAGATEEGEAAGTRGDEGLDKHSGVRIGKKSVNKPFLKRMTRYAITGQPTASPAYDSYSLATNVENLTEEGEKLEEMFKVNIHPPLPIEHILLIARTIKANAPNYDILNTNCFYYSLMLTEVLKGLDGAGVFKPENLWNKDAPAKDAETFFPDIKVTPAEKSGGPYSKYIGTAFYGTVYAKYLQSTDFKDRKDDIIEDVKESVANTYAAYARRVGRLNARK